MELKRLEDEITELAAHINAATCRWLELVAEFDRREGWANTGCKSCAHWIAWRCAMSPGAAREHMRVARRLEELPLVRAAFASGELSYSKVRALTRVENVQDEAGLVELAENATAAQLERIVGAYRGVLRVEDATRARRERFVSLVQDDDGSWILRGRLPAEQGALLQSALGAGRDDLRRWAAGAPEDVPAETPAAAAPDVVAETPAAAAPDVLAETPAAAAADVPAETPPVVEPDVPAETPDDPHGARTGDALMLLADSFLAHGAAERSSGDRYQVVVHVDAHVLSGTPSAASADVEASHGPPHAEECELADGGPIAPETARRLACDSSLVAMVETNGVPLRLGRKTRTIPPAMRRALRRRDPCCRFPGCGQRRGLDGHHIIHWAHGGATELDNLIHLCAYHHHLLHEGGFRMAAKGRGHVVFHAPDGRELPAVPIPRGGDCGELRRRAPEITPTTCVHGPGERFHLGDAVELVLALGPPPEAGVLN